MLYSELDKIRRVAGQCENAARPPEWSEPSVFVVVREQWTKAYFSGASDQTLRRYFSFHQEGIRDISDRLYASGCVHTLLHTELLSLLEFQRSNFREYFDASLSPPVAYTRRELEAMDTEVSRLTAMLEGQPVSQDLQECVLAYLHEMQGNHHQFTYRALFYHRHFVSTLLGLDLSGAGRDAVLAAALKSLNYNHLGFFKLCRKQLLAAYDQLEIAARPTWLAEQLLLSNENNSQDLIYDKDWPSLSSMLSGCLLELKDSHPISSAPIIFKPGKKLPLNLSVAHLALLIRLFFEEKLIACENLSLIFRLVCAHYSTKRSEQLSTKSLKKHFYNTEQVTAAVVRDLLVKMISRIDRTFFPV